MSAVITLGSVASSVRETHISAGNVLGEGIEITGTIKFREEAVINGKIEGEIISESRLIISDHALVTGEVSTEFLILFGRIRGNATVTGRAVLKSGSEFYGDLTAERVEIEEGTTFVGQARIIPG